MEQAPPGNSTTPDVPPNASLTGYAYVSVQDDDLLDQEATLRAAGCGQVFAEKISGSRPARPQLACMLHHLRPGDVIVVTRLGRLARSVRDLLDIVERIREAGAGLRSLGEPWADTTTAAGHTVQTVFAGLVQFERGLIVERTGRGRAAARARGTKFGRKPVLTPTQLEHVYRLADEGNTGVQAIASMFGIHRSTVFRILAQRTSNTKKR